jgi:alkanesulfonate monooxygenase SsuD/methylene tetrahydromethanopterin reductase-like flavin-dependent oxidoreductase (luciferase family)
MSDLPVPLSVLDLAPVSSGQTAADALHNTLDLARRTELLGYHRYWVAEHHLLEGVASAAPAVLIALLASATSRIRVGSGAVLLGYYSPLMVAEQFGTIAHLHPDRIDLGLGRSGFGRSGDVAKRFASATDDSTEDESRVVNGLLIPGKPKANPDAVRARLREQEKLLSVPSEVLDGSTLDYKTQVQRIQRFIAGEYQTDSGRTAHAAAAENAELDVWVLGSSAGPSAAAAGELGLPYAANYHVSPSTVLESVAAYRDAFVPSHRWPRPYVMVSADVVVAEDEDTARELASPYGQWVLSIRDGRGAIRYPSPEEAARFEWTQRTRALVDDRVTTQIVGTPEVAVEKLRALRAATDADELMITTATHSLVDRVRSFELLAKAWEHA